MEYRTNGGCMKNKPKIILLNGAGSVGKTSLAKALQGVLNEVYLHLQMDAFIDMMPRSYQDHPQGFSYETIHEDGKPQVVIQTGIVGERTLRGMRHAIVAMAQQGSNLIVDDVMLENENLKYADLLSQFDVKLVGVFAPLNVLEKRELKRGDRMIGLARWQYDRVHKNIDYDFTVDTSIASPIECAELIKEKFRL